jgi:hypothetical protein
MTTMLLESVGLCAQYSKQGDWAFDFAFNLARERNIQLNIFYFLEDPYKRGEEKNQPLSQKEKEDLMIKKEKELRMYYDDRLGEHLKAGFRVCEEREWTELRRCMVKREFQLIVVPYPEENATFGGQPIEEFALRFVAPVMLVGPNNPSDVSLNPPARLIAEQLTLPYEEWTKIPYDLEALEAKYD